MSLSKTLKFCLFLLVMCFSHNSQMIEDQYKPYFIKFVEIAKQCEIPINTSELRIETEYNMRKKPYIAVTYVLHDLIRVKYKYYRRLSESEQEQTIMHELGHSLLNLEHDNTSLNIMTSKGFIPKDLFEYEYDYFIRRLFINCKAPLMEKFEYDFQEKKWTIK